MVTPTIIYVEKYYKAKVGHQGFQGNTLKWESHDYMQRLPKPSPVQSLQYYSATDEMMEESGSVHSSLYMAQDAQT